jgi:SAM-dependent methyltransferase
LDRPLAWEALRLTLDAAFGLYRRTIARLERWGVLDGAPSVLDVGLGVDMTESYIERARRRWPHATRREFRAADVRTLEAERRTFDVVLMVDVLHHLDDALCENRLGTAARLSRRCAVLAVVDNPGRAVAGADDR